VQADKNGHYSVMSGTASAHGLPADVFAGGEARWLGVQPSGEAEQPRIVLLSVPYALKAADSETLGGLPPSAFVRANPETVHPGESSGASNSVPSPPPASANKAQPATLLTVKTSSPGANVGFIPLWTGSKSPTTQIHSSSLFQAGTNLGIGNTNPAARLDVFSATNPGGPIAKLGSNGTSDSSSVQIHGGGGTAETFVAGCIGCFVPGAQPGDGGMRVSAGKNMVFGDASTARATIDSAGNALQHQRTAGGWVKGMAYVNALHTPYTILKCFNSTLTGAAATTPPCGISFTEDQAGQGYWDFDFGFGIDDRFFTATLAAVNVAPGTATCIGASPISSNTCKCRPPIAAQLKALTFTSLFIE
jgi:hypothetical protein